MKIGKKLKYVKNEKSHKRLKNGKFCKKKLQNL